MDGRWTGLMLFGLCAAQNGCTPAHSDFVLVRRVVSSAGMWHPANDNLDGSAEYCTPDTSPECYNKDYKKDAPITFSEPFDITEVAEFLFATQDCGHWVQATPYAVRGEPYAANLGPRPIIASSDPALTSIRWRNSPARSEDPSISDKSIGTPGLRMLYREASSTDDMQAIIDSGGANVWIKYNRCKPAGGPRPCPQGQACGDNGDGSFFCLCGADLAAPGFRINMGMERNAAASCSLDECMTCPIEYPFRNKATRNAVVPSRIADSEHFAKSMEWCGLECEESNCETWTFGLITGVCRWWNDRVPEADIVSDDEVRMGQSISYSSCNIPNVCVPTGQQECRDVDTAVPGDWVCACLSGFTGADVTQKVATCTPDDECDMTNDAICNAAMQDCVDPDPTVSDDWQCKCRSPARGVGHNAAASQCALLTPPVDLDECETCAKVVEVEKSGDRYTGTFIGWIADVTEDECMTECLRTALCYHFTYVGEVTDSPSGSDPACVIGESCCAMYPAMPGAMRAAAGAVSGKKNPSPPCHQDPNSGAVVCDDAGQLCVDSQKSSDHTWQCHCPDPLMGMVKSLGPAACTGDECSNPSHASVCESNGQDCRDPDEYTTGDWLCVCRPPQVGAGLNSLAVCAGLTPAQDLDECQKCAEEVVVTAQDVKYNGAHIAYFTDIDEDECTTECLRTAACEYFTFVQVVDHAPTPPAPPCTPGTSCCALFPSDPGGADALVGALSGKKEPKPPCFGGGSTTTCAGQACVDSQKQNDHTWECQCILPEVGVAVPLARASCSLDECQVTANAVVCTQQMQDCRDPDMDFDDNWLCVCRAPAKGAGRAAAAGVCEELTPATDVNECDECAWGAQVELYDQGFAGGNYKTWRNVTEAECVTECGRDARCHFFAYSAMVSRTAPWKVTLGCVAGASCCALKDATASPTATPFEDIVSGRRTEHAPCHITTGQMGVCAATDLQRCVDADRTTSGTWRCECIPPATGAAVSQGEADCTGSECVVNAINTATCEAESQDCLDPDENVVDDWLCMCRDADGKGAARMSTAECRTLSAAAVLNECATCAEEAVVQLSDTAFQGMSVAFFTAVTEVECKTECVRNALCRYFTFLGRVVNDPDPKGPACTVGASCCALYETTTGTGALPDALSGNVQLMQPCHLDSASTPTCEKAGQTCDDPDQTTSGNWECKCVGSDTAKALGVADCPTPAPQTQAPDTAAPLTPAPPTLAPPTPAPATVAPPTPAPLPVVLPTIATDHGELRSEVINTGGGKLVFGAGNPLFAAALRGEDVPVVVLGPTDPLPVRGDAYVLVRSSLGSAAAPNGFVATAQKSPGFATATVSLDGTQLQMMMNDGEYVSLKGKEETLTVTLTPELFDTLGATRVCEATPCEHTVNIKPETPQLANQEKLEQQTAVTTYALGTVSAFVPVSTTGPSAGLLALSTQAMLCPGTEDEREELDLTLNPLGLSLGSGSYPDSNGAVVGALLILTILAAICSARAVCVHRSISDLQTGADAMSRRIDRWFFLMMARVGWLVMPLAFLYGGASVGSLMAIVYSSAEYKILGLLLLFVFVLALPATIMHVCRSCNDWCAYVPIETSEPTRGWVKVLFWGRMEWCPHEGVRGARIWTGLHHLGFDAYTPRFKYFMAGQLIVLLFFSALSAWQAETLNQCWWRTAGMTALMTFLSLFLVACRPYIAPYENVLESAICLLETAMLGITLVAMGSPNPSKHWGADVANMLGFITVYVIVTKFILDLIVFIIDEYNDWAELQDGATSYWQFVQYFVCFRGSLGPKELYQRMQQQDEVWAGDVGGSNAAEMMVMKDVDVMSDSSDGIPGYAMDDLIKADDVEDEGVRQPSFPMYQPAMGQTLTPDVTAGASPERRTPRAAIRKPRAGTMQVCDTRTLSNMPSPALTHLSLQPPRARTRSRMGPILNSDTSLGSPALLGSEDGAGRGTVSQAFRPSSV
eukprot:TRINITY_DN736_c3_g2_i1.p1 TRINITY_DN736_c3_g2~~TRINITY_DN736_c3_g2_i1.p1  ORF type:complete len:1958 (+),score=249.35 TRINITY_DN736_c3_g2_i1:76-5949(+)